MYIIELKDRLDTQRELDIVEQNTLKQEIETLQEQLKDKDLEIIGREKQLCSERSKVESDKRRLTTENDIAIAHLEAERQTIRVSTDKYLKIKRGNKVQVLHYSIDYFMLPKT